MDYRRIYDAFIADRFSKFSDKGKHPHRERHHVVPKCLGGSNDASNLISLSYSDHIFAHLLLAKIHGGKLAIAFQKMTTVARYQGRHTRWISAALIAESRRAKGDGRRGDKGRHTAAQAAGLKRYNESRRGKPGSPALIAARRRQGEQRRGKPAHPNALAAISRKGADRSPAQIARDQMACEIARKARKPDAAIRSGETRRRLFAERAQAAAFGP